MILTAILPTAASLSHQRERTDVQTKMCFLNGPSPASFCFYFRSLKNGPCPASFSFIFVFSIKHYIFYNKEMWKMSINICGWDLNPRPLEYETPPITTRPGLLPIFNLLQHTFYRKNCRRQRDSNSDRRTRRQARWPLDHHHGGRQRWPLLSKWNVPAYQHTSLEGTNAKICFCHRLLYSRLCRSS